MWGDQIRRGTAGRGIPAIERRWVTAYWSDEAGHHEESDLLWYVTYPDTSFGDHSECCGRTTTRSFDNWPQALAFALARSWER